MRLFPNIRSRLRGRQLNNMLRRKNISHPLMILLSDAKPSTQRLKKLHASYKNENDPLNKAITAMFISNQFYSRAFLSRIDAALGLFGRGEQEMCHAVKGLLNEDQFFQTVSELDVAAQLRKSHPVILQHKVGSRPVDIKVAVDGREYLIEVYGPDTELRLKYVRTAMIISNRVRKRILEKIDKQLKHVAASTTLPILLAIDKSRAADIDEIDVLDTMKGSLSVGIAYNSDQSNPAQTYVFRRDDSIARDSPDAGVVSAIILLKRDMDMTDYKVKLYGEIYLNEKATRPLDECEVGSFRLALFEQSLD